MPFNESIVDVVRNGVSTPQKINVERDATDQTRIAPARVLQLNGTHLSDTNPLPAKLSVSADLGTVGDASATSDVGSFSLIALFKRLLTKLPSLVSGRIPIDGSGVTQPITGVVAVSNFPASSGGGGGTQYADGVAQASPVGNVVLGNRAGTLKALQLDVNNALNVSSVDLGITSDVAAPADTGAFSLIAGVKRLLGRFTTFLTVLGAIADVADTTGSLMARFRAYLDRVGSFGDTASSVGSINAKLRFIADSLNRTTSVTAINESLGGDRTIITVTATKSLRITSLYYTVDQSVNITLKAGTATALSGAMPILDHAADYSEPLCLPIGQNFVINLSGAANLRGYVIWYEV